MRNFSILFLALFLAACAAPAANDAAAKPAANSQANASPSLSPTAETAKAETVTMETPDGVKLVGSFYTAKEANSPALLLLHQWTANRHTYDRFAERMNAAGYAVLSIDGRGFGESTKRADSSEIKVDLDKGIDPKLLISDANSAVEFLKSKENVDASRIAIVGASYGSSVAMMYAADHPEIAAVVLLSPGVNYFDNLPTIPAIKKYGTRPILLVAAEDDKDSAEDVKKLKDAAVGADAQMMVYPEGGHGTAIFDHKDPDNNAAQPLADLIANFLNAALKPRSASK